MKWKITGVFAAMIIISGLLVVAIVSVLVGRALRAQIDQRALATATNFGDGAAGHMMLKNPLGLDVMLKKYAGLGGVAYLFVEDRDGMVVAHSLRAFPPDLREPLRPGESRQARQRVMTFEGKRVYETRVPILGGQLGTAHLGIWGDAADGEILDTLTLLVGLVALVFFVCIVLVFLISARLVRPIRRLASAAEKISEGNLDTAIDVKARGEVQDLARSLERIRVSLKEADSRLSARPPSN